MLHLLVSACYSLEEPEGVVKMDRVLFRRYVETREPYQPWLVAFTRNGSKKCAKCTPLLDQVASKCYGYMFVGRVDQDEEPLLARDYNIEKNWTVLLFNKGGYEKVSFPCDAQKYYRLLIENLPSDVLDADPSWIESSTRKPSAILFTSRFKVPHLWRAIGGYFKEKGLRIGLITEPEYIAKFDVKRLPSVVYFNSSGSYPVQNVPDYKTLRSYLNAVRRNKQPKVNANPKLQRFFLTSQYKQECKDGHICVVHCAKSIDPRFALKETRFADERLRFFSGSTDLPFKFMKENEIYIFQGPGKGVVPVENIHELDEMIKFVIKGTIKWTPMEQYSKEL